jgi:hypothetical protein
MTPSIAQIVKCWMTERTEEDMEGSVCGVIWDTILAFAWKDLWNPQNPVRIVGLWAKIWTWDLPISKQECYSLDADILCRTSVFWMKQRVELYETGNILTIAINNPFALENSLHNISVYGACIVCICWHYNVSYLRPENISIYETYWNTEFKRTFWQNIFLTLDQL